MKGHTVVNWPKSEIILQWNPSVGETLDQMRFSCRKVCWKSILESNCKNTMHISLVVSVYKLFKCLLYNSQTICQVRLF